MVEIDFGRFDFDPQKVEKVEIMSYHMIEISKSIILRTNDSNLMKHGSLESSHREKLNNDNFGQVMAN
jgi:hypothetical protein